VDFVHHFIVVIVFVFLVIFVKVAKYLFPIHLESVQQIREIKVFEVVFGLPLCYGFDKFLPPGCGGKMLEYLNQENIGRLFEKQEILKKDGVLPDSFLFHYSSSCYDKYNIL
jgi:hypothetical protein